MSNSKYGTNNNANLGIMSKPTGATPPPKAAPSSNGGGQGRGK